MIRLLLTVVLHDGTAHDTELRAPESTPLCDVYRRFTREWGPRARHRWFAEAFADHPHPGLREADPAHPGT